MSQVNRMGPQQDNVETVIEIAELIKLTLDLTGLIQRRLQTHHYDQQSQAVAAIRGHLAQVFDMDLFPNDHFASFLAGAFDGEPDHEFAAPASQAGDPTKRYFMKN